MTAAASLDLVLLGAPGSGKGTQAETVCHAHGLPHIATGDLFRQNIVDGTALGRLAQAYMNRGELVPDEVTESMVRERLTASDARQGFVLDGFPRTLPQGRALDDILAEEKRGLAGVIYLEVPDQVILDRLSQRRICSGCQASYHLQARPPASPGLCDRCGAPLILRADDAPATVRARLQTFHIQTNPLVEFYERRGQLRRVDGQGGFEEVSERVTGAARAVEESAGWNGSRAS